MKSRPKMEEVACCVAVCTAGKEKAVKKQEIHRYRM